MRLENGLFGLHHCKRTFLIIFLQVISPKKKKKKSEDPKPPEPKSRGFKRNTTLSIRPSQSSTKSGTKKSVSSMYSQGESNNPNNPTTADTRRDGAVSKKASGMETGVSNNPIKNPIKSSPSLVPGPPPKEEMYNYNPFAPEPKRSSKRELPATIYQRPSNKKPSCPFGIGPATHGAFLSQVLSNTQHHLLQNGLQEKISAEELNAILQNVMTWVVATVTSILYPAITMYEERLRTNIYPLSDDSVLSSGSSSFCSTCSDEFAYRAYSAATAKKYSCTDLTSKPVNLPPVPEGQPMAKQMSRATQIETTILKGTYASKKGQTVTQFKMGMSYDVPRVRSCKSDSQLLSTVEICGKKDATTETEELPTRSLEEKEKEKEKETEVFIDQLESEKEAMLSNVDVCSAAADIVENMLEKLQSAVEKKCIEIFSQEDLSLTFKSSLSSSEEEFVSKPEKPFKSNSL
ncbi:fibrous sheath-interacting protein 2-like [Sminthopsis crassicaudata]|uniref:fibrous sheath-interacting protein 2-like n=1 Tax=Sminthopsis crassicaudata TaxID=9301 RepID=UPI003D684A17